MSPLAPHAFLAMLFVLLYWKKKETHILNFLTSDWYWEARGGGAEVAGLTLDRKIRVRFPAYPHRVWALWWQGGKRRLRTYRCPCRGRLGTLKTPSCPWRGCPAAGPKFGNWTSVMSLYSWNIAECDVKPQSTTTTILRTLFLFISAIYTH